MYQPCTMEWMSGDRKIICRECATKDPAATWRAHFDVSSIITQAEKVKAIAKILKSKFTNLSVEEVIDLAYKILEAIEKE